MKYGHKMINGSTEDINANLREIILLLNDKVSNLREKDGLDFVIISLRNLQFPYEHKLRYTVVQVERNVRLVTEAR